MCAKASKPLTSFQPASLLLVWDPIFGFKGMKYDVLFSIPISVVHGWGPQVRAWALVFLFICVHGVWILTFVVHLSLLTNLLCSAWLRTTGTHPLF